ncbi:MAG: hypothetical protein WBA93_10640 [Microcoleaceae cyanobacterium]
MKALFWSKLGRWKFDNQAVDLFVQCALFKLMIQNGKPESYKVEI